MSALGYMCALALLCASELPPSRELLDGILARFPTDPLMVEAELIVGKSVAQPTGRYKVNMFLDWHSNPSVLCYTIRDMSGNSLERLTAVRRTGKGPELTHESGNPLVPSELPDLFAPVLGTDLTWGDLMFSFLWWREGVTTGTDTVRGRSCYVVNLAPDRGSSEQYKTVSVWVDRKFLMVMQAQGYDAENNLKRQLSIESLKKVNKRWMVKDIMVESFPSGSKTRLHVLKVNYCGFQRSAENIEVGQSDDQRESE